MLIAAIRPDSVNFPLFLHVLGAMLLVGTLIGVGLATVLGWRSQDNAQGLARFSLKMLLLGVLPAYILMRIGAQWTEWSSTIRTISTRPGSASATSRPMPAPC